MVSGAIILIRIMSASSSKKFLVFVYGTLKRKEPNHHVIDPAKHSCPATTGVSKFIGQAKTVEKFPLVIGTRFNIPFLLDRPGVGHAVNGEVYEVDQKVLEKLDKLEDYPTFYDREVQPMKLLDDER